MDTIVENIPHCNKPLSMVTKLYDICNWYEIENVAIEYHDLNRTICISYKELLVTKTMLSDFLQNINGFKFIGINFDVPEYCVISLMLGILSCEFSFVIIPVNETEYTKLKNMLHIHYLFCKDTIIEGNIMKEFIIHGERIYLMKLKENQKQDMQYSDRNHYAYAICTSGSTGAPKVVKVMHACIIPNILDLKAKLNIQKCDKIAQFTSFTFDPSIIEIFLALSSAGTLFMSSKSLKNNANRFLEVAYSSQITVLQMTPSVFLYNWTTERLKATILSGNTSLRVLLLGGEPFPKLELFLEAKHPSNNTRFYNIYGITELSCWASINEIITTDMQSNTQYLGQVLSQTTFQVKNEKGELVSNGTGFLYIGSGSRICVIDDENVQDLNLPLFRDSGDIVYIDEESRIFYKGRSNNIIKRFGNKIHLTELEKFVLQVKFIKNCYVLWDESHHKLYLCLATKEKVTDYSIMNNVMVEHLQNLHPLYRPDKILFLEHFEFTSSGKISTNFLKKCIDEQMINTVTNNTDTQKVEEILRSLWRNSLNGENSGFLKLGGTSIIALQISSTMSKQMNVEFPELIGMLLNDATIDECFNYVTSIISDVKDTTINSFKSAPNNKQIIPLIHNLVQDKVLLKQSNAQNYDSGSVIRKTPVYKYQWHKCKGHINIESASIDNVSKLQYNTISKIEILKTFNLYKCIDASPIIFRYSDEKTYATVGSHSGLITTLQLELESCFPAFTVKLPDRIEASVLILDDFRGIVGCYDGNVYCIDLKTGKVIWKHQTGDVVKCSAVACKERRKIFVGSYDCYIYCLSIKDGLEIWKDKTSSGSISASGCLHLPSDCVLFGTLDGSCLALEQSSGKVIWRHKLTDPIFIPPVTLSTGLVLFCSVTGTLICFDIEINVKMWQYKVNGNVFAYVVKQNDPLTRRESIILASQNKNLYHLESTDANFRTQPTLKYVLSLESPVFATPWCENNILFIACTDGTLYIYNFITNTLTKTEKLPGEVFSSPVVYNDIVIIGCRDNNIYVLKLIG